MTSWSPKWIDNEIATVRRRVGTNQERAQLTWSLLGEAQRTVKEAEREYTNAEQDLFNSKAYLKTLIRQKEEGR